MLASRVLTRTVLIAAAATLALCVAEGIASIAFRTSLLDRFRESNAVLPVRTDADRVRLAAAAPGCYRAHPDPRVRYALKADFESTFVDAPFHTDALGLRRRLAGEPGQDALRVVLLGDSIVFGFGLDDEHAPAEQLERLLNGARVGDRPVAVRAVACPGWNHRNQVAFLLDHWAALRPDLVVHVPVSNDLFDSDGVGEAGIRTVDADPASRNPWLTINANQNALVLQGLAIVLQARHHTKLGDKPLGSDLLGSDLAPESQRRFDANAQSLRELAAECARRGAGFAVAPYLDDVHSTILRARLADVSPPWIPLLRDVPSALRLEHDAHPNANTVAALMAWLAQELIDRKLVTGFDVTRVGDPGRAFTDHRATAAAPSEVAGIAATRRSAALAKLSAVLDLTTGEGALQILGGFQPDGAVDRECAFGLSRRGTTLSVELGAVTDAPELYPQSIEVYADGARLGTIEVTNGAAAHGTWPLPTSEPAASPVVEVRLVAPRAAMTKLLGMSRLAAAQFVRASCE